MSAPLADAAARARIAQDLDTSLVVEAAAGTGKTSALVGRMVAALEAGRAEIGEVVAVTFTDAAAGELRLRLRAALEAARARGDAAPSVRERVGRALARLEEARIGTIHSFCAELLREHPLEAGIDPDFAVLSDDGARSLLDRVVDRFFEKSLDAPGEAVRRLVRRRIEDAEGPREALRRAAWELCEHRDFTAPWSPSPFERGAAIDALLVEVEGLGAEASRGEEDDWLARSLHELRHFAEDVRRREDVSGRRDYDGLEARFAQLHRARHWGWRGRQRERPGWSPVALRARRDALRARVADFLRDAGAELAYGLRVELSPLVDAYAEAKSGTGALDFLDLLLVTRALLRDDGETRARLQRRFRLLFVDEFQDTDPLQAEILFLLASDDASVSDWRRAPIAKGKLFLVGDPKQSIYRFRRADVALYEAAKAKVVESGGAVVELSSSFRSVPALQAFVNAAFAPRMTGAAPFEARYVPLSPVRPARAQPALVALPVPAPYGKTDLAASAVEASAPVAVAAFVEWLVHSSGWTVDEGGAEVPIRPEHVCVLFRRLRSSYADVAAPYLRALEARRLPHVLVGASAWADREEIRGLVNALAAIDRPDDELSVFAALHGPFFALGDGALLAWRERFGTLHPHRGGHRVAGARDELSPAVREVGEALDVLRALHAERNRVPFAATVQRLLAATRAHAGLAIWSSGEQALANVARVLDLARRAERRGVGSFRAFAERLAAAAQGSASDAPAFEHDALGVRLMTVHKCKGLEFPVVVLADVCHGDAPAEPSRFIDPARGLAALRLCGCTPREVLENAPLEKARDDAESLRLLYVAATRARDLLVVPAVGDAPMPGWVAALHPALYPKHGGAPLSQVIPGAPPFGRDATLRRPPNVYVPDDAVVPGVHAPREGHGHAVVWWDPSTLDLEREDAAGLRQQKLLELDEGGVRADAGARVHADWQAERARVREAAAVVAHPARPVTAAALLEGDAELEAWASRVRLEFLEIDAGRPRGARFGRLVHGVLAALDLDAPEALDAVLEIERRLHGATLEEVLAARVAVARALAHPWLVAAARAAREGSCRRELGVVFQHGDGIVEGLVDLAYRDGETGEWRVVDFKTDRELEGREAIYRRQVALYARAIALATGVTTHAALLRV